MDWLIRDAWVIDGVDGEYRADLGIAGDRIVSIQAPGSGMQAKRVLHGGDLVLTPGFIDIHRHGDLVPFRNEPWPELAQGITTMVCGNCGFSLAPSASEFFRAAADYAEPILGSVPNWVSGLTTQQFYDRVPEQRLAINCGYMVGSGALRRCVAGFSDKPLTPEQTRRIHEVLADAFEAGALGLSMGLMYTPECYYATDELAELAKIAARYRKPVVVHIRGEGRSVVSSVNEMIEVGYRSGAHIHISHLKAAGRDMWGSTMPKLLDDIDQARRNGLGITFDAYPYNAGSSTLLSMFPPEMMADGTAGLLRRIANPDGRLSVLAALHEDRVDWDNLVITLGWEKVFISSSSVESEIGRSIGELADQAGVQPAEFALNLLLRDQGKVLIVIEHMAPEDVRKVLKREDSIVISDSLYADGGKPHPRKFGTFQRFLCQYVKDEKLLSRQKAIDKMTRLPAELFQIERRGRIQEGWYADLVLLDWENLRDRATYNDPTAASEGIRAVFINGQMALENGLPTHASTGKLLNRPHA